MKIGLIDVDGHNFPNLPLMKLSAWHKQQGDQVEWYEPLFSGHMDRVYMSKVFTFTQDYQYCIDADEIIKSGTGYINGEISKTIESARKYTGAWHPSQEFGKIPFVVQSGCITYQDILELDIEHCYPDYELYGITDTAYGFLTRGCPRGCDFCIVQGKEGAISHKVADLSEFWRGQKEIKLLDPNLLACKHHMSLLQQLIDSKAWIDITQGFDARLLTEKNTELIMQMKVKDIHFAWDRMRDEEYIAPKLKMFKEMTGLDKRKLGVYVLTNKDTTHEEDLYRIYTLRDLGYWPYVMIYNKETTKRSDTVRKLQRWVNMRAVFEKIPRFEDYVAQ